MSKKSITFAQICYLMMGKYHNIVNPMECSIEELEAAVSTLRDKMDYFGSLEQGCKKFINSVYGALGSSYYVCANTSIAESITLQGQDLIKYSVKCLNKFFIEYWNNLDTIFKPSLYVMDDTSLSVMFKSCYGRGGNNYIPSCDIQLTERDMIGSIIVIPVVTFGYGLNYLCKQAKKKYGDEYTEIRHDSINGKKCVIISEANIDILKYINNRLSIYYRMGYDMNDIEQSFDVETFVNRCINVPVEIGETCQVYGDTDSAYVTIQPLLDAVGIGTSLDTRFILSFKDHILDDFLKEKFEEYAVEYNCDTNLESFELEKIARSLLMQKKKKYVMDISWKDPGEFIEPLQKLVFKGVEAAKGESSLFVRGEQKKFVRWIMDNINKGVVLKYPDIVKKLRGIKERFAVASYDDICKTTSISDYEKYVFNDTGKEVIFIDGVVVPYHARAASWYNNLLFTSQAKYRSKYPLIKRGEKVKVYTVLDPSDEKHDRFAYIPGNYPNEFAPKIDINKQFSDLILDPLNRYIEALGYDPIGPRLTFKSRLY